MDDNEFLAKVDTLMEHLERQAAEDSVGDWAVSAIKDEIRRRILKQSPEPEKSLSVPIEVRIEKKRLAEVIPYGYHMGVDLHGVPYEVTLVRCAERNTQVHIDGFFSATEAEGFLIGLRAARVFGLPFKQVPCIEDLSEREIVGGGVD